MKEKKALEKSQKENQQSQSESKQEKEQAMDKIPEKSKEQILAERQAKKAAKQTKSKDTVPAPPASDKLEIHENTNDADKAKIATKAERRAIQESQRAAKAKALEEKNKKLVVKKPSEVRVDKPRESIHDPLKAAVTKSGSGSVPKPSALHKVKLFKHLYTEKCDTNINVNHHLHPAILKLGLQYSSDSIVGSNARCYAFLNAMKTVSMRQVN